MKVIFMMICIIAITGCIGTQNKGPQPTSTEEAPAWFEAEAQTYLENKLGKEYVAEHITFKKAIVANYPEFSRYEAHYAYDFPYNGEKRFQVIQDHTGNCCSDNGPTRPHTFATSESKAISLAKTQGMTQVDGVRFVLTNRAVVEHDPPNPNSKNELIVNEGNGDYILEAYTDDQKKGEVVKVYIDSDSDNILGYYIAPNDYKSGDVVSTHSVSAPSPIESK